jgi:hypothetical protein
MMKAEQKSLNCNEVEGEGAERTDKWEFDPKPYCP